MVLSLFREELPWLYEIGLELYRAIKRGNASAIDNAIGSMQRAIDFARHSRFMDTIRNKEIYYFVRELPMLMDRFIPQPLPLVEAVPAKATKKKEKNTTP